MTAAKAEVKGALKREKNETKGQLRQYNIKEIVKIKWICLHWEVSHVCMYDVCMNECIYVSVLYIISIYCPVCMYG